MREWKGEPSTRFYLVGSMRSQTSTLAEKLRFSRTAEPPKAPPAELGPLSTTMHAVPTCAYRV